MSRIKPHNLQQYFNLQQNNSNKFTKITSFTNLVLPFIKSLQQIKDLLTRHKTIISFLNACAF